MGYVYLIMNAHGKLAECTVYNASLLEVLVVKKKGEER